MMGFNIAEALANFLLVWRLQCILIAPSGFSHSVTLLRP